MVVPHDLCILQDFGTYMAESSQFAFTDNTLLSIILEQLLFDESKENS